LRESTVPSRIVDNVTHALTGAAIAECAVPAGAPARLRAVFMVTGLVAANAPDIDLLYSGITAQPLGYLLHHRGHSHTWPGLALLGVLMWAILFALPQTRMALRGSLTARAVALIAVALVSHLLLDAANSYGTHLFYPFSGRWVYGDAVFVLEPWLWAILGATIALNAGRVWRSLVAVLTVLLIGALAVIGLLPLSALLLVVGAVGSAAWITRTWDRRRRAAVALAAMTGFVLLMAGVSRVAKAEARAAATALNNGAIVDIVADANPGAPWCWAVLTLQRSGDNPNRTLVAHRATLSLLPQVWPAASCASAKLSAQWSLDGAASRAIVWQRRWTIDLEALRTTAANNCRARAWLQFGRVPRVENGVIADLRFENPIGQNFTPMAVDVVSQGCPAYLTAWPWPRRQEIEQSSVFSR